MPLTMTEEQEREIRAALADVGRLVDATSELCAWDWSHLLVDGDDAGDLRRDADRVETALVKARRGLAAMRRGLDATRAELARLRAEMPSEGERALLDRVRDVRRGKLAGAVAADLECCATDTPCIDGCPYGVDQDTPHAEDCAQEETAGVLLALAALLAPEGEVNRG